MLRPLACALLAACAVIPAEQPEARAETWQPVKDTEFCFDSDSIKEDGAFTSWNQDHCPSAADFGQVREQMKVNCEQPDAASAGYLVYIFYPVSGNSAQDHFLPMTAEGAVITSVCSYWLGGYDD